MRACTQAKACTSYASSGRVACCRFAHTFSSRLVSMRLILLKQESVMPKPSSRSCRGHGCGLHGEHGSLAAFLVEECLICLVRRPHPTSPKASGHPSLCPLPDEDTVASNDRCMEIAEEDCGVAVLLTAFGKERDRHLDQAERRFQDVTQGHFLLQLGLIRRRLEASLSELLLQLAIVRPDERVIVLVSNIQWACCAKKPPASTNVAPH